MNRNSILVLGAGLLFAAGASAQQLGISTAPQGTAGYGMAAAIAKVITEKAGMPASVQPYSGSSAALPPVNAGETDLSVCNEIEAVEAASGAGPYAGRKQDNLRIVSLLYPFSSTIFVRKDSPMKTMADLKGKRLTWGYTAQVTLKGFLMAMLANGGLTEKDIQPVMVPNVARGADDFASGKADAFFFAPGSAKVSEVDAAVGGIRALQMSNEPAAVEAAKKIVPVSYVVQLNPRPGLAGIVEPTYVLGYDYMFVAGKHVKDDVVYKIAKALAENKDLLAASFAPLRGFQPDHMAKKMDVPFHPGAIKYLTESKQWPPK